MDASGPLGSPGSGGRRPSRKAPRPDRGPHAREPGRRGGPRAHREPQLQRPRHNRRSGGGDGRGAGPATPRRATLGQSLTAGRAPGGKGRGRGAAAGPGKQQRRLGPPGPRPAAWRGVPPGSPRTWRGAAQLPPPPPAALRSPSPRRGRSALRPPGSSGGPAEALPATGAAGCHSAASTPIGRGTRVTRSQRAAMETAGGRPRPALARREPAEAAARAPSAGRARSVRRSRRPLARDSPPPGRPRQPR